MIVLAAEAESRAVTMTMGYGMTNMCLEYPIVSYSHILMLRKEWVCAVQKEQFFDATFFYVQVACVEHAKVELKTSPRPARNMCNTSSRTLLRRRSYDLFYLFW